MATHSSVLAWRIPGTVADLEGLLEEKQRASKDADLVVQVRDGDWALR